MTTSVISLMFFYFSIVFLSDVGFVLAIMVAFTKTGLVAVIDEVTGFYSQVVLRGKIFFYFSIQAHKALGLQNNAHCIINAKKKWMVTDMLRNDF